MVVQLSSGDDLALKTLDQFRSVTDETWQDFDSDLFLQSRMSRQHDQAHPAASERPSNSYAPMRCTPILPVFLRGRWAPLNEPGIV